MSQYHTAIWALLNQASPALMNSINTENRRFEHDEIETAIGPEVAGQLTNLVNECGDWTGPTMSIPNPDGGRSLEVYDDGDESAYPNTAGLCFTVEKQV